MKYSNDLTNMTFGKLTALYKNGTKWGQNVWHCSCECGRETDVPRSSLISGNTKSCGCLDAKFKKIDFTGQIIGNLTVLYDIPDKTTTRGVQWHCRCICGNEIDMFSDTLRKSVNGVTQKVLTCGKCNSYLPKIKYGHLTPILRQTEMRGKYKFGPYKCDCGKEIMARISSVNYGTIKSCGCIKKENHYSKNTLNLVGQKFGMLTVQNALPEKGDDGSTIWHCTCDCGGTKDVPTNRLRSGATSSCGCKISPDLTGKRFGRWTVLYPINTSKGKLKRWHCKCDCGTEKDVLTASLNNGASTSCGCYHNEIVSNDISDMFSGLLTVIRKTGEKAFDGSILWECQCECGKATKVTSSDFLSGNVKSCGCLVSYGENQITKLLDENNISYKKQKTFSDCRFPDTNQLAKFDFWINEKEYLIEFDGSQHFSETHEKGKVDPRWQDFEYFKTHDEIKDEYCKQSNIPLIRIPYKRLSKLCLEDLLLETTQFRVA